MDITKKKAKQLFKLVDQWTREEIMARLGDYDPSGLGFADHYIYKIRIEEKIRKLVYGTDDLVAIGLANGLLKPRTKSKRTKPIKRKVKKNGSNSGKGKRRKKNNRINGGNLF